jgi:hypothetical protein
MVRKGAASEMDKFTASLNQVIPPTTIHSPDGCGCAS